MKIPQLFCACALLTLPLFAAVEEPIDSRFVPAKAGTPPLTPEPPTLGAKPPRGAVVLFDGKNLDAWAKKAGKDWLKEDGPGKWKLVDPLDKLGAGGGAVEVVPASDCLISHQKFGDVHLHAEFRTLGAPTNSGIYFQTRYEVDINETFGRTDGNACGNLGNCTPKGTVIADFFEMGAENP